MNRVTIIGNLTRDPETRNTQDGKTVCVFTVAVNRYKRDENGNTQADFFRVSAWDKLGENCQKFLTKGKKVAVIGPVSVHAYTAQDGSARGSLEVRANDVEFLSGREDGNDGTAASAPAAPAANAPTGGFTSVETDELPFEQPCERR